MQIKGLIDVLMVYETKLDVVLLKVNFEWKIFVQHLDLTIIKMVLELCLEFGKIYRLNY